MYAIPVVLLLALLAIGAVVWSPLFAVIAAVLVFVAFLAYAGPRPRARERVDPRVHSARENEDEASTAAPGEPPG